jgi:hypothetical protein
MHIQEKKEGKYLYDFVKINNHSGLEVQTILSHGFSGIRTWWTIKISNIFKNVTLLICKTLSMFCAISLVFGVVNQGRWLLRVHRRAHCGV